MDQMWVNRVTGETSDLDPTSSSTDRSSGATVAANSGLMLGTLEYNTRRNKLAERGRYRFVNVIALVRSNVIAFVRSKADHFSVTPELRHLDTPLLLRIHL